MLSGLKRATTTCTDACTTAILQPRRRPPHERYVARGLLLLLLLLFELLLLLQLVLTFLLRFFGCLLLARLDVGFVLSRFGLLFLEALLLLYAFLSLLRALLTSFVELALKVGLLLIVSLLIGRGLRRADAALRLVDRVLALLFLVGLRVGGALRRLCIALCLVQLMLTLLLFISLGVARVFGGALRRASFLLRALELRLLVTFAGALRALFAVERELFLADLRLYRAHLIACLVQAVIDEERAVAIMLGDAIAVVVFVAALVQHLLPRVELALSRCGAGAARCAISSGIH